MGDIARCSLGKANEYYNEDLLYRLFGVNAELLIDNAWGFESCTIKDIKDYKPDTKSVGSGQVLSKPYSYEKTETIIKEMVDLLVLDLIEKKFLTNQLVITIGYDIENIGNANVKEVKIDHYGRAVPKSAHGTINIPNHTSSLTIILKAALDLFNRIIDKKLLVRRIYVTANNVLSENSAEITHHCQQLDFFTSIADIEKEKFKLDRERNRQDAIIKIKRKFGKNAILKGLNFTEDATLITRNSQIGGHKS